jgi:hypothetical protein
MTKVGIRGAVKVLAGVLLFVVAGVIIIVLVLALGHKRDLAACARANLRTSESNRRAPEHTIDARDLADLADAARDARRADFARTGALSDRHAAGRYARIVRRQNRLTFALIPLTDCAETYRLIPQNGGTVYLRGPAGGPVYRLPR